MPKDKTPLEIDTNKSMNRMAGVIAAEVGNSYGFSLLVFPFEQKNGPINYISNARHEDMIKVLELHLETIRRGKTPGVSHAPETNSIN